MTYGGRWWWAVAACALVMMCTACSPERVGAATAPDDTSTSSSTRPAGAGIPVKTAIVEQKPVPVTVKTVGTVEALSTVQIHAQVTGQLSDIHFKEGDTVRKGDPLFDLDPRPFDVVVKQAEAVLARDTAQANSAEAQRTRTEELFNRGLIARNDYEVQVANAAALQATVDADAAAVDAARLNLAFTHVAAPATGRSGALQVHIGDLIHANDATPMVVLNQVAPIYVTASVPGRLLDEIQRNQMASPLRLEAGVSGASHAPSVGRMSFVDNAVDTTTGAIKIKGEFANNDGELWPGLFVDVTVRLSVQPDAIVAPSNAVQQSQQGPYVYVVNQDRIVEMRPVAISRIEGDESVVSSGLKQGERVVVDGQLRLTPGARVTE